jgi:hypothetical protein
MGVSPPPIWLPKKAITPEQVIRHHRSKAQGGMGGQALSLLDLLSIFYFIFKKKNFTGPKNVLQKKSNVRMIKEYTALRKKLLNSRSLLFDTDDLHWAEI